MYTFQRPLPTSPHLSPGDDRVSGDRPLPTSPRTVRSTAGGGKTTTTLYDLGQRPHPTTIGEKTNSPPTRRSPYRLDRPRNVIDVTAHASAENPTATRDREAALERYQAVGLAQAERDTGVPKSTLRRWAREAGLDPAVLAGANAERTAAAVTASTARATELRAEVKERFLETAALALDRLEQPYVEFRGKDAAQVTYDDGPPAQAFQAFVVAAATALDKFRLEVGEATELHGVVGDVGEVESMRDELAKRRLARAS